MTLYHDFYSKNIIFLHDIIWQIPGMLSPALCKAWPFLVILLIFCHNYSWEEERAILLNILSS